MKRDRPGPLHGDCIDCIGRHCGQHAVSLTGFESISIPFQSWLNAFLIFPSFLFWPKIAVWNSHSFSDSSQI
jgi:hypothetical protein